MCLLIARMMWGMDFRVAGIEGEGQAGASWGREMKTEFQLWDIFSAHKEGPVLQFKRR
jgi:hypothetical protein